MEIHQINAFLAVAEELHFGRAAQRLRIAQPPLSRTIRQFEKQLGSPLFDRSTRTVRLTAAGEALLLPAREILDACRMAEIAVSAAGQGTTGRVR
ncbi:LysR family transcriptional regulator, partial [Rhodococcus erythropolis]|nr:LysR family transcriptional regulator [Rhodococcus erythropolis]